MQHIVISYFSMLQNLLKLLQLPNQFKSYCSRRSLLEPKTQQIDHFYVVSINPGAKSFPFIFKNQP